ncbi:copper-binding protein [Parvularcula dongshanensis]|uniref:Cu/Ag efflux protein CusF n=1 Tax=Parvularcula dongshanensis TaxID=1173995 RepID=A0A840I7L1_9PROT|nr:copper-binding protein [Parvularcula dongshanensis]MBB4660243.1 Cu/Ag efflux protein CusF [Parvularcula dongshanensis]
MRTILTMSAATLLLAACGVEDASVDEPATTAPTDRAAAMPMQAADMQNMDRMDHDAMMRGDMSMGMGKGRVVEIDEDGNRVRIDHDAIEGVGMAAMTMFFEAKRGVDLAALEAGDEVHFMLEKGRDSTYRISAICDIEGQEHERCMASMHEMMPEGMRNGMGHDR